MENTLSIYVEKLHEQWDMPDSLALKWTEYEKDHPLQPDNGNADALHTTWFHTLSADEQRQITRTKADE